MISLNVICMVCAPLVDVAFSRYNFCGGRCLFTCKRALHTPPMSTVVLRSIAAPATTIAATGRLKREDYRHIKLDSAFSKWKILVGASDWKDYSMGKEGAEKYRTQNLPNCTSCPGNYELGIATSPPRPGRQSRELDSSSILPVYFGQADNVRARLQKYGRDGAHLENGSPNGPGLFSEIFMRGFSIVYRWAPMKSKEAAQRTEDELLATYDYAWNKRGNGDRRPDDIRRKLEYCARNPQFSHVQYLKCFWQEQLGNKIDTCDRLQLNSGTRAEGKGVLSRIFTMWRLQPIRVQSSPCDDSTGICGVAIGHGSICTRLPVKGRKRCAEHKGVKINHPISKFTSKEIAANCAASTGSNTVC